MPKWIWNTILLGLAFSSCGRMGVDHEGLSAAYLSIDDVLVDSILDEMSMSEKIGQILIWRPDNNEPQIKNLPAYFNQRQIAGYFQENFNSDTFLNIQDTLLGDSTLTPFIFTEQPLFVQNNFANQSHFPSPINAIANNNFEGFGSFWRHAALKSRQFGFNAVFSSPLKHFEKGNEKFEDKIISIDERAVLRNAIAELNSWQNEDILVFGGPLDASIYNPQDSVIQRNYPWRTLYSMIQNGLDGIYVDPALYMNDSMKIIPPDFLDNYLNRSFDFNGLLVSKVEGELEFARAYLAGVDMIISSITPTRAVIVMEDLFEQSVLAENMLDDKVRKILKAKIWMTREDKFDAELAAEKMEDLLSDELMDLSQQVRENAIALIQNRDNFLPLNQGSRRFRIIEIGTEPCLNFRNNFEFYANGGTRFFSAKNGILEKDLDSNVLKGRPTIFLLNKFNLSENKDTNLIQDIKTILSTNKSVLINIGFPENLNYLDTLPHSIIQCYDNSDLSQRFLAEMIFGGREIQGKLPLTVDNFNAGNGILLNTSRIRKGKPEEVGMDAEKLYRIEHLAYRAINKGAFPGCQVAIVKNGLLIYEKAFGHLDSAGLEKVKWNHLYDVASISKVAGTALAGMRLYERDALDVKKRISSYLDLPSNSKLKRVTVKDLLTHRSGLRPNMPIVPVVYPKSLRPANNVYTHSKKAGLYQIQVADKMFFNIKSRDSVWNQVWEMNAKRRRFRYSDVNFMILQRIIEKQSNLSLDQYVDLYFYKGLNLRRTAYRPLEKFKRNMIAPSAHDRKWRQQLLRGYVHDEAAALEGGVGGNAGLFSNARDLAVIGQLLLNKGTYGGQRFLKSETIEYWTKSGHGNHRGLAFDKKSKSKRGSIITSVSSSSYGHTGFTGSLFWVDPKHDLVFVFNTNRIHPKVNNRKIYKGKYRKKIHQAVYRALAKEKDQSPIPLRVNLED